MKLLYEQTELQNCSFNDYSVILEEVAPNKPREIKISGPYIVCDQKNINGRVYDRKYFEEEVIPEYDKNWLSQHRAYAELTHPDSQEVDPRQACELITELKQQDNIWIGTSVVLNSDPRLGIPGTPTGDILGALVMRGGKIGKSTRGAVQDPKNKLINKDNPYYLITIDTVLNPSGPGCYINDVITEGVLETKEFMIDQHGVLVECAFEDYQNKLKTLPRRTAEKNQYIINAFETFLKDLKK